MLGMVGTGGVGGGVDEGSGFWGSCTRHGSVFPMFFLPEISTLMRARRFVLETCIPFVVVTPAAWVLWQAR